MFGTNRRAALGGALLVVLCGFALWLCFGLDGFRARSGQKELLVPGVELAADLVEGPVETAGEQRELLGEPQGAEAQSQQSELARGLRVRVLDVDWGDPPQDDVVLHLPPTGGLLVAFVDEEGMGPNDWALCRSVEIRDLGFSERGGRIELLGPPTQGLQSLGDVILREEPIQARGVVLDPQGQPVEGAFILVESSTAFFERYRDKFSPEHPKTDRLGRFELRGLGNPEPLLVAAVYPNSSYLDSKPQVLEPGNQSLELMLRKAGVVTGQLLLDASIPASALSAYLKMQVDGRDLVRICRLRQDGFFRVSQLELGPYRLIIKLDPRSGRDRVVDFQVIEAETTRLDPIELLGLNYFAFRVVDEEGNPVPEGIWSARINLPGGEFGELRRGNFSSGLIEFLTFHDVLNFELKARNFRNAIHEEIRRGGTLKCSERIESGCALIKPAQSSRLPSSRI
jgi:hypothetical protein